MQPVDLSDASPLRQHCRLLAQAVLHHPEPRFVSSGRSVPVRSSFCARRLGPGVVELGDRYIYMLYVLANHHAPF